MVWPSYVLCEMLTSAKLNEVPSNVMLLRFDFLNRNSFSFKNALYVEAWSQTNHAANMLSMWSNVCVATVNWRVKGARVHVDSPAI